MNKNWFTQRSEADNSLLDIAENMGSYLKPLINSQ